MPNSNFLVFKFPTKGAETYLAPVELDFTHRGSQGERSVPCFQYVQIFHVLGATDRQK